MSEITFNDNNNFKYKSRVILGQAEVPKMTKFLMSKGIVKNEKQATGILFLITLLCFSLSIYLIYNNFFKKPYIPETSPEQDMFLQPEGVVNTTQ